MPGNLPWGYRWRSSQGFMLLTASLGLFCETFLYSFVVPVLGYMIEGRLQLPPSERQWLTTALLTTHGVVSLTSAPIIAHFADKSPNRKVPFLLALIVCLVGTILLAICPSVSALFVGRIMQALSGSAIWIIAFATLNDNVNSEHIGRVLATAMSFTTAGMITGISVSGALLQLLGYWAAWSAPFVLIFLSLLGRLMMIEKSDIQAALVEPVSVAEEEALLSTSAHDRSFNSEEHSHEVPVTKFYQAVLCNVRVLVGLLSTLTISIIITGFDTTLPIHLERTFNWGSLPIGMVFLGLQVPGMLLGPIIGSLRDRVGVRYPTTVGWILIAPLLCLLCISGTETSWIDGENAQIIFVTGIIGIGAAAPLVRGVGIFQLIEVVDDIEAEKPGIFGPHGGSSRIFSVVEVAFDVGTILGPILSGALVEALGFNWMVKILGAISMIVGLLSWAFLSSRRPTQT